MIWKSRQQCNLSTPNWLQPVKFVNSQRQEFLKFLISQQWNSQSKKSFSIHSKINWGIRLNVFGDLNLKTFLKLKEKGILFTRGYQAIREPLTFICQRVQHRLLESCILSLFFILSRHLAPMSIFISMLSCTLHCNAPYIVPNKLSYLLTTSKHINSTTHAKVFNLQRCELCKET